MVATAKGSSSSGTSRPDALAVDLAANGLLAPLPAAFLAGRDLDLLAPLAFVPPGGLPELPPARLPAGRRQLSQALAIANRAYGHPEADRLARRLADPATRVVVTGQQPGLLGGPLYSVSKAMAAARWVAALEAAGEPAVAVFWVATEDHDWAEVASTTVPTATGPRDFSLGPDPEPLVPVGMRTLGPEVLRVLDELREAVPGERYAEWVATLGRWYRPDTRFGEAYCRLLAQVLGARCPLLLDAMLPALKEAERPWLARVVERRRGVEEASAAADREIAGRGYPLQVQPQRGASPLFLLRRGQRRRVEWRDLDTGRYRLRGTDEQGEAADLLQTIEENPAVVSPGVMARPAIQDAVLGTTLQVLGPGEVSYMPQIAGVYPVLEIEPPAVSLRPQALVLEEHQVGKLEEVGLRLADLLGDRGRLERLLADGAGERAVAVARERVEEALGTLREPALEIDPSLDRPWEKTREQVMRGFDTFAGKLTAAAARRDEVRLRRVEQLREACLPHGRLQERVVAASHFPGKHGERFAEALWEQLDLDPRLLQVVVL